jgi:hypothetical protein
MTVWAVNTPVPLSNAHRQYPTLQAAAADIVSYLGRSATQAALPPKR